MKAVILNNTGDIKEIKRFLVIEELPEPRINEDEVLIKIKYASLNHRDLWITKGLYAGIKLPIVLGSDCSGIIAKTGKNVNIFCVNEEVIINPGINWGENELFQSSNFKILGLPDNGTLEEYIAINKKYVYKKPLHLSLEEAAAIPLAGLTAYRAVFVKGKLEKNKNVLITGIGGGVSTFAFLFAVYNGNNVYITSGNDNKIDEAIRLGAKDGINYKNKNWDKDISIKINGGFDLIIDGTGGNNLNQCLNVLNPGGVIVNYGATTGSNNNFEIRKVFWKQASIIGTTMGSDSNFREMLKYIEKNKIRPILDKTFEFTDTCDAFIRMDKSEQLGKILIKI